MQLVCTEGLHFSGFHFDSNVDEIEIARDLQLRHSDQAMYTMRFSKHIFVQIAH